MPTIMTGIQSDFHRTPNQNRHHSILGAEVTKSLTRKLILQYANHINLITPVIPMEKGIHVKNVIDHIDSQSKSMAYICTNFNPDPEQPLAYVHQPSMMLPDHARLHQPYWPGGHFCQC